MQPNYTTEYLASLFFLKVESLMSLRKLFKNDSRPSSALQKAAMAHGLCLYYVKYMGSMEVQDVRGSIVAEDAMKKVC